MLNYMNFNKCIDTVMEITGCSDEKATEAVMAVLKILDINPTESNEVELFGSAVEVHGLKNTIGLFDKLIKMGVIL